MIEEVNMKWLLFFFILPQTIFSFLNKLLNKVESKSIEWAIWYGIIIILNLPFSFGFLHIWNNHMIHLYLDFWEFKKVLILNFWIRIHYIFVFLSIKKVKRELNWKPKSIVEQTLDKIYDFLHMMKVTTHMIYVYHR